MLHLFRSLPVESVRLIVFDLDGTLIDSRQDLCNSVNATLEHFGLLALPDDVIASFIGDGAAMLIRRALAIKEKVHGADHPDIATSLSPLAGAEREQGHYAEAESLLKRALAIREKAFGPDSAWVAQIVSNLASLYVEQQRYADAEPLLRRALDINQKTLGPEHPDLAGSLWSLGSVDTPQGRYADAEPLLTRALEIQQKALGRDHPDVARTFNALAGLYDAEGRNADALTAARKATEILIRRSEQRGDDRAESGQRERQSRRDYFLHLLHLLWNQSPAGPGGFNNETIDEAFAAAQYAGLAALTGPQDAVSEMVAEFDRRRRVVVDGLNRLPGISCAIPKGAFYAFPNVKRTGWKAKPLASALLEDSGVALIGGPDFGVLGEGYMRVSYANSTENILRALNRIGEFLATRKAA